MVLRKVKNAAILRHLHVKWQSFFKSVLPINGKAKEVHEKIFRFPFIENPKNGCCISKGHTLGNLLYQAG